MRLSKKTIYFTSLGCSKNLVDSEVMLGHLGLGGFEMASEPQEAEVIIINTCSFIEASKVESIDTILEMAEFKAPHKGKCKVLVVSGCLAQRYSANLEEEMPEVDLIIGTGEYHRIVNLLKALEEGSLSAKSHVEIPKFIHTEFDPRINTSPFYSAYLKISEGCNRNCTFCIIPTIRGKLRSRTVDSLVAEATNLAKKGVVELNLISQDLSDYGVDLPGNSLLDLLNGLETVNGIKWIRLFYFYPDDMTNEVMEKIAASEKICKYLDMPIQHFSDHILKRMNRRITGSEILSKLKRLREKVPGIIIRTSIIVGFPGETEEDFQEVLKGVEEAKFNHLGIFRYSDEEGTPAFKLGPKVPQDVIEDRFDRLYKTQLGIVKKINREMVGKNLTVLVEGKHEETDLLIQGRFEGQAPEIDGKVIINDTKDKPLSVGQLVKVKINKVMEHDLLAEIL